MAQPDRFPYPINIFEAISDPYLPSHNPQVQKSSGVCLQAMIKQLFPHVQARKSVQNSPIYRLGLESYERNKLRMRCTACAIAGVSEHAQFAYDQIRISHGATRI